MVPRGARWVAARKRFESIVAVDVEDAVLVFSPPSKGASGDKGRGGGGEG